MKTRLVLCALGVILGVTVLSSCTDQHGKAIGDSWRKTLGIAKEDGPYRWFAYPVDNFGVATFYDPPKGKNWIDSDRICATWSCLGIANPAGLSEDQRLKAGGFADYGGGGQVSLTGKQSKELAFNLAIPLVKKLVALNGDLSFARDIEPTVTIERAYKRSVDRFKLQEQIAKSNNRLLVDGFAAGRLAYVAADVVGVGISLTLKTKSTVKPEVRAKLAEAVDALSKDTALGMTYSKTDEFTTVLKIAGPVILGVQTRSQPAGGTLSGPSATGEALAVTLPRPDL